MGPDGPDDSEFRPPRLVHAGWVAGEQPMAQRGERCRPPQTMIAYVHVRRELVDRGAGIQAMLDDINARITGRGGIVLASRQILTSPNSGGVGHRNIFQRVPKSSDRAPGASLGERQRNYFSALLGMSDPFQYAEEREPYQDFCIGTRAPMAYLRPGERALALVDATRDERYFYCPCHYAEVVYTSAHRLVCMSCGQMHCVLAAPLRALPALRAPDGRTKNWLRWLLPLLQATAGRQREQTPMICGWSGKATAPASSASAVGDTGTAATVGRARRLGRWTSLKGDTNLRDFALVVRGSGP